MVYKTHLDIVDNDTGEVLTRNKQFMYNTEISDCHLTLLNWLLCFERGLKRGKNITFLITAKKFEVPEQKDLF